jgi:hypothetical protein
MKIEKNKIVFAAVLGVILIFLISYSLMVMGKGEDADQNLENPLVPELVQDQKDYDSKLDAINDLKEVRETNAPSIYDDALIDSLGFYDPDLPKKEKERIVDSIYDSRRIAYSPRSYENIGVKKAVRNVSHVVDSAAQKMDQKIDVREMGLEHQLFFASEPKVNDPSINSGTTDDAIYVVVNGDQVVRVNSRLRMRLAQAARINNRQVPKNTPIFGFISIQPNRVLIEIESVQNRPTNLKAFDLQDGSEGIYIKNSFRAEATNEVLDDVMGDINIPTVPQINGITKIFKRDNRNIKVTVLNNYRMILKPKL